MMNDELLIIPLLWRGARQGGVVLKIHTGSHDFAWESRFRFNHPVRFASTPPAEGNFSNRILQQPPAEGNWSNRVPQ